MGNHGAASARAQAGTVDNRALKSTDVKSARSKTGKLADWPVARRLFAVIVLALLMGLVFGGLRLASAESSAAQFGRVSQLATLGQRLSVLVQDLQNERDTTVLFLVNGNANELPTQLQQQYARTNDALNDVQASASGIGGAFPANIQADATTVMADIAPSRMRDLRSALSPTAPLSEQAVIGNYGAVINDMITLADQTAQGVSDASLASDVRASNALALAKEQASQQRALLNYLFSTADGPVDSNLPVDQNTLQALQIATNTEFTDESAFQAAATPAELSFSNNAITSPAVATDVAYAQELELSIFANVGADPAVPLLGDVQQGIGPLDASQMGPFRTLTEGQQVWNEGMTGDINGMQSTENLLAGNIVNRAGQLKSGAQDSALVTAVITGVVLLLVLAATLFVARSLVLPLRRLRAGALDVASVQLPERVRQLSESPETAENLDVAPINVLSSDEIGQVARAFDQVHAEAVRLAGNEAVLRTSFNAMFVNLSRRSQSLIERLARMVDSLEQNEDDPDRLSSLFTMDHLVTRMRRNSENLLLLAGHESARKWSEPVLLADITRAAISEIEQYGRVVLNVQPGVAVIGPAVSDVVHLLAELIENATAFSPNDTQVQVSAQELTSGGVLIEVSDKGIGVSESRLEEMNWRLDNPPVMDVTVSRHMGLFAVARLAERHRVRVRLRAGNPQGLTALVWLPDTVIERSARRISATGGWQAAGQSVQESRRASGQHSIAAAGQHGNGRIGTMRPVADATQDRDNGAVAQAQRGQGATGEVSQAVSNWFRSRHTAMSAARMPVNAYSGGNEQEAPAQQGGWGPEPGGLTAGGRRPADIVAEPVLGEQTASGLPMRIPKANLIPGSANAARGPGGDAGVTASLGEEGGSQPPARSEPPLQRSPELARSRLSGFQRGARRAEGQIQAGEGADR
jgi:signal transduction histidine kinase